LYWQLARELDLGAHSNTRVHAEASFSWGLKKGTADSLKHDSLRQFDDAAKISPDPGIEVAFVLETE